MAQARLGTAASFAILAGTPDVFNTGPSVVIGDLGIHPGIAVTGFPPGTVIGAQHAGDAVALQAKNDLTNAYTVLAGEPCPPSHALGPDLSGLTLAPGVYCFTSTALLTVNATLTLDAQGDPGAEFIFQVGSALTVQSGATVSMINGGSFCNVFWKVGSSATVGTNADFVGNIVALTDVSLQTGANVFGRALARNGRVTLDDNHITNGGCAGAAPVATPTLAKAFDPATINAGGVSTLTITLSSSNASPATGAAFTDTLPGGVTIDASPSATNTCGGVLSATAGSSALALTGGTIPGGSSATPGVCTVTVHVTATTAGSHVNTLPIGALTTSNGDNATEASATLTVPASGEVTIGKAFSPASITAGGDSTLTITLSNANAGDGTGAAFTDTLPAGVVISASPSATNTCGGVLTASAGSLALTLTGATIPGGSPFGTCTVTVHVTADASGSYVNTLPAGALTTSNGNSGASAVATLTVSPAAPSGACEKLAIQAVLDPTSGRFPGNLGPDLVVRVGQPFNESIQAAVNALAPSGDLNGDGYIIVMVVNRDDGKLGGDTNQRVEISAQYTNPFGLLACSVTMHTPDPGQPSGHILSSAGAPLPPFPATGNIFVMDLHGADSGAAGWQVDGNGRVLRNVNTIGNNVGTSFVGNGNTLDSGRAEDNDSHGFLVQGNANSLTNADAFDNDGDGVRVIGNTNVLSKVDAGDRGKPNGGDGLHVEGNSNQIVEGGVFANSGHGVFLKGNSNKIVKTDAGDRSKGNGIDGFHVEGSSNLLDSNVSNANSAVGINFAGAAGTNNMLKKSESNQSGQGGTKENDGAEYCFGNATTLDQGGNKKDSANFVGVGNPKKYAQGCSE
jgi:uncharacterized repeat protein (TIGR01451 family)